jgi:hypothetical protein
MYKITLTLTNPVTNDTEVIDYQFNPTTLDQAKWNGAFQAVRSRLDALVQRSTAKEPATW